MVRRYDVISSRWSSHFCIWVKIHVFFPFLSRIKVNRAKCLFMCYFSWKAHKKYTTCCRGGFKKIKGFQKSFRNTTTYQKLWGELLSTTRFLLLKCTTVGGMNLCVRPRVDMFLKSNSLLNYRGHMHRTLCWTHHRKYFGKNGLKKCNTALDS